MISIIKLRFALFLLLAGAPSQPAFAAIVASIPMVPPLAGYTFSEPEGYRITAVDFDGDAQPDVWFNGSSGGLELILGVSNRVFTRLSPPPNIGGLVANLAPDVTLSLNSNQPPGNGWFIGEITRRSELEVLGLPLDSTIATLGISNSTGETQTWLRVSGYVGLELHFPDGLHYAWIHIDNDPVVVGYGGYLDSWAYESEPAQPITTGAVPEPSAELLLIAVVGVFTKQRRRGNRRKTREP